MDFVVWKLNPMAHLRWFAVILFSLTTHIVSQAQEQACNAFEAVEVDVNQDGALDLATVEKIDERYRLHLFLTPGSRADCQADYTVALFESESELVNSCCLSVNSQGSLVVRVSLYPAYSGIPYSLYDVTMRLENELQVIGYDHWPRNIEEHGLSYSINLLNGTAMLRTVSAMGSGGGVISERLIGHGLTPFPLPNGEMVSFPKDLVDWEYQQFHAFELSNTTR